MSDEVQDTSGKSQLIHDMGKGDNDTALRAVEELRAAGWLTDGSLKVANLAGASLMNADLREVDLRGATLYDAHLVLADLRDANLEGANLMGAELQGADLGGANLQWVHLQGTKLYLANLQEAALNGARLDEETTLPDGATWTPDIDLDRFTDPEHPDFWRSDEPRSPAYRDVSWHDD